MFALLAIRVVAVFELPVLVGSDLSETVGVIGGLLDVVASGFGWESVVSSTVLVVVLVEGVDAAGAFPEATCGVDAASPGAVAFTTDGAGAAMAVGTTAVVSEESRDVGVKV